MTELKLSGVLEAALYVDDLDAADAFYAGVLGLPEIIRFEGRHIFYRVGQTVLLLFRADATEQPSENKSLPVPTHGARGQGHICFSATRDEIDEWHRRLTDGNHPIEADFEWPNGARSIYFRDPHGNSLEIAERRLWF
ncbi:MAG: VOC family protein [Pseudomonadota bacterium]